MIYMKLALDKRYKRNDGTCKIVFRITYEGQSRDISSGFTCKFEHWNEKQGCLFLFNKELETLDKRLREQRLGLQERILEYERSLLDTCSGIQDIKNYLTGSVTRSTTVLDYWEKEIKILKRTKRYGNARSYSGVLTAVLMSKSLNIPFKKLNYKWVVSLDTELRARGLKTNTVSVYMRTLRALYNKAINEGIADADDYPFNKYRIRTGKTTPRVASIEELRSFFNLNLDKSSWEFDHWNYGKLIFMLRGINFTDLALLTKDNIKQGRIVYKRSKTHKLYSIAILPEVQQLISLYDDPERLTLFPILTNDELKNKAIHPSRIAQLRKNTNKWLKRLGMKAEITEPLSTYVFRYSYANACKKLGFSKDLIAEALGHEYGNSITGIYLEQFDLEYVDEMNQSVMKKVLGI
ncbi:MAG: site-specific integrase [Crocinitomicaceae bacterium]|nr:site-specific integrase [Crocinitomicaceae bacterium]